MISKSRVTALSLALMAATSSTAALAQNAPIKAAPVQAAPVQAAPVQAAPVQPAPVRAALVRAAPLSARARSEKAIELYRQANRLYDAKKLTSAEALYREAWSLQRTYDIATNLGALELDLGKAASAAEHLSDALRMFPARGKPAERAAIEARLERAKKLACTLHVKTSAPGAQIFVDGHLFGTTPLAEDLFLDPGTHAIEARQPGRRDAKRVLRVIAGFEQEVALVLPPIVEAPRRSPIPGIVAGAAGLLALGVGGTFIGVAEANRGSAHTLHDRLQAAGISCAVPSPSCTELQGHTARADTFGNAGIGVMVAGGALVAAGAAYLLWPTSKPAQRPRDTALSASFGASPSGGALVVMGSF